MKTNGRVLRNVFITTVRGCPQAESLSTRKCESEDPPTWKTVLEKCMDLKVALLGFDLAIENYKSGGRVSITEPPAILDDPEFFQEPDDSSSE